MISIPILVESQTSEENKSRKQWETASVKNKLRATIEKNFSEIEIDEDSIRSIASKSMMIVEIVNEVSAENEKIKVDGMKFQVGLSLTGSLGFVGTGAQAQVGAVFEISFKMVE